MIVKPKSVFTLENVWKKACNDVWNKHKRKPTWDEAHTTYHYLVKELIKKGNYIKFTHFYSGGPLGKENGVVHDILYGGNNANVWIKLEGRIEFMRWNTFSNAGYTDNTEYLISMKDEVRVYSINKELDPYGEEEWDFE